MARDISNFAKSCLPCETSKDSNPAEAILTHEPAAYPFQFLHMDIGQESGQYYLITTDQYSGYPNISSTGKTCNTKQVISATLELITYFSIPEIIYSDGGPQFLKDGEFDQFCKEWGIKHVLSSPYMPRSNGHAEAAVKQMKKLIRANISTNGILNKPSCLAGLQVFRNTPRSPTGISPNEMIFGKLIRDSLPVPREHLLPQFRKAIEQRNEIHRQKQVIRQAESGPRTELKLLSPKTPVRIQDPISKKWDKTGFVISFGVNNREYLVRIGHKIVRRNRHFLKEINVEATSPLKQPAQAPDLPILSPESEFGKSAKEKIRFGHPTPTSAASTPLSKTTPTQSSPATDEEMRSDQFPMPTKRGTLGPSVSQPDPTPAPKAKKPQLSWPNNAPVKPRKKPRHPEPEPEQSKIPSRLPNSFQSNNKRTNRMANASPPRSNHPNVTSQSGPFIDPINSNWRKQKDRWDTDSRWTPPSRTATMTTPTPSAPRTPRSTTRRINYNEN